MFSVRRTQSYEEPFGKQSVATVISIYFCTFVSAMEQILSEEQLQLLGHKIDEACQVACICHVNPDGDAMGSTLAIAAWMTRLGKECRVIVPNRFPDFLGWMPGADKVLRYDKDLADAEEYMLHADLLWICDMNGASRALEMENILNECSQRSNETGDKFMVMVDHHLNPVEGFCNMQLSHPEMCATCEVICHLMHQMGEDVKMSVPEATCLYTGMMTDTGAFTYASTRSVIYECISLLLSRGIDKDKIYRNVFWTASPARMRLIGYLLYVKMEVIQGMNAAVMTLTNQERRMLNVKNGDTEGIVNMPLQIQGLRLSALISEDTEHPGFVKFSLRSVDDFPCNEMSARFFNGGGHKNASGGRMQCTIEEALEVFRHAVKEFGPMLQG